MMQSLLGVTLGLSAVLLLRKPARRCFGAGTAFTLWLLPPLLALLPWLPSMPGRWDVMQSAPVLVTASHFIAQSTHPGSNVR